MSILGPNDNDPGLEAFRTALSEEMSNRSEALRGKGSGARDEETGETKRSFVETVVDAMLDAAIAVAREAALPGRGTTCSRCSASLRDRDGRWAELRPCGHPVCAGCTMAVMSGRVASDNNEGDLRCPLVGCGVPAEGCAFVRRPCDLKGGAGGQPTCAKYDCVEQPTPSSQSLLSPPSSPNQPTTARGKNPSAFTSSNRTSLCNSHEVSSARRDLRHRDPPVKCPTCGGQFGPSIIQAHAAKCGMTQEKSPRRAASPHDPADRNGNPDGKRKAIKRIASPRDLTVPSATQRPRRSRSGGTGDSFCGNGSGGGTVMGSVGRTKRLRSKPHTFNPNENQGEFKEGVPSGLLTSPSLHQESRSERRRSRQQ